MTMLRRFRNFMLWLLAAGCLLALIGLGILWIKSPGTAQPITQNGSDVAGSVSTVETFTVGGVTQSVILRGYSADAPVLLVLHGGPGSPAYPFFRARNPGLEQDFIVAYWEQRGAGLSYDPSVAVEDLTIAQMVGDAADIAAQLAARFDQDRVYLLGHSWGGALAVLTAQGHPDLFNKVFAVSPVIAQYDAEQAALAWLQTHAANTGDADMETAVRGLELPVRDAGGAEWLAYLGPQRHWLDVSGAGTAHDPISLVQLAGMLAGTPDYTIGDKWRYLRGSRASMQQLWPQLIAMDLRDTVQTLQVPIVFIHGAHDRITPASLTQEFADNLTGPLVETHIFDNSAHSALFEEPDAFNALLRGHLN